MKTVRLDDPGEAARYLRRGKLVAFPTETVFGLGVDASNSAAVGRLFDAKGRPSDNPLIVHVGQVEAWPLAARQLTPVAKRFLAAFAPGPLTVVLPKNRQICSEVTAALDTVGVRIPGCELAREMLTLAAVPVAAPSANRSGRPSCTKWQSVLEDLDGRIDAILCHNPTTVGLESTVVDCCLEPPTQLRPGAISLQELCVIVPDTKPLGSHIEGVTQSPGLRHPHYQPHARVVLFESDPAELGLRGEALLKLSCCGLSAPHHANTFLLFRKYANTADYARNFYEFLRESDRQGASLIACQLAPLEGIGLALRDRQLRAAAPRPE